jgi:hypothetical protein
MLSATFAPISTVRPCHFHCKETRTQTDMKLAWKTDNFAGSINCLSLLPSVTVCDATVSIKNCLTSQGETADGACSSGLHFRCYVTVRDPLRSLSLCCRLQLRVFAFLPSTHCLRCENVWRDFIWVSSFCYVIIMIPSSMRLRAHWDDTYIYIYLHMYMCACVRACVCVCVCARGVGW